MVFLEFPPKERLLQLGFLRSVDLSSLISMLSKSSSLKFRVGVVHIKPLECPLCSLVFGCFSDYKQACASSAILLTDSTFIRN